MRLFFIVGLVLLTCPQLALGASFVITPDTTTVQTTDVEYQFRLSLNKEIPARGKVEIRFPEDYSSTPFDVRNCYKCDTDGSSCNSALDCEYNEDVRMLTVHNGNTEIPSGQFSNFFFTVSGMVNPDYAGSSDPILMSTYSLDLPEDNPPIYTRLDTMTHEFTAVAGALTQESLVLSDPTVAAISQLTVNLKTAHILPKDGMIILNMPKWNSFVDQEDYESLLSVSTNPGEVTCQATQGFESETLYCELTQEDERDILRVKLEQSEFEHNIAAGTALEFTIEGCRSPPSLTPIDGFTFETVSVDEEQIDVSATSIQLASTTVADASPATVQIQTLNPSINQNTHIGMKIIPVVPLPPNSHIEITIPEDFIIDSEGIYSISSIDYKDLFFTYEENERKLTIETFNTDAINPQENEEIDITFGPVTNPGKTQETATFTVKLFDNEGAQVEQILDGITFFPIAGIFETGTTIEVTDDLVSAENVGFKFKLFPTDQFENSITNNNGETQQIILEVLFPKEIYVQNGAYIEQIDQDGAMNRFASIEQNLYNRKILITNVLNDGEIYDPNSNLGLSFTIKGVNNPTNTAETEPWSFALYYEEGTNEVTRYAGSERTFQASPSTDLEMEIEPSVRGTGEPQAPLTITGKTSTIIQQGSSLELFIPKDFVINDYMRVAASCTVQILTDMFGNEEYVGFSDQITCQFDEDRSSRLNGHFLTVEGGFASQDFEGGEFKFEINDVLNPFTTEESGSFSLQVKDAGGNISFKETPSSLQTVFRATSSDFAYAYVESLSPVVGAISKYSFALTFGVDTPEGTIAVIDFPDEIEFPVYDETTFSNEPLCTGTHNLNEILHCPPPANARSSVLNVHLNAPADPNQEGNYFRNGTTVAFTVGMAKNPTSFKPSSTFRITTKFGVGTKYDINRQTENLQIQNTVRGAIQDLQITRVNEDQGFELASDTQIRISLRTSNPIPLNGKIQVTLPKNLQVMQTGDKRVTINGRVNDSCNINPIYQMLECQMFDSEENKTEFEIEILRRLKNPSTGPYSYEEFSISFLTANDKAIDGIVSREPWIVQQCDGNCIECKQTLGTCLKCGIQESTGIEYFLNGAGICVEECNVTDPGFFNGDDYTCKPCEYPCKECHRSATACTACEQDQPLIYANPLTYQCYEECPEGTYTDEVAKVCNDCPLPGYTCESQTEFTSCDRSDPDNLQINHYAKENKCYESCPPTSIQTPDRECIVCKAPCFECADQPDLCVSCLEGFYLHKQECLSSCPMAYIAVDSTRICESIGELDIPFPFTIMALVISIGLYISSWMKGSDKLGKERPGTAYFIAIIAIVDILLRFDWLLLCIGAFTNDYWYFFCFMLVLCLVTIFLNLVIWRKYFHTRYRYDKELDPLGDKKFKLWMKSYPKTALTILFLTYVVSFQAIRLSYSRLLGKAQFYATFTQRRRYFRLIGRISMLQIFILYFPSIGFMIYGLYKFTQGTQIFYYAIDGLILTCYATILIIVVLSQREAVVGHGALFEIKELFSCEEIDEEFDEQDIQEFDNLKAITEVGERDSDGEDKADCKSAQDYYELQKRPLFQNELRGVDTIDANPIEDAPVLLDKTKEYASAGVDAKSQGKPKTTGVHARPVTVINYDQYRKLEEKKERILLKKKLYLNKREADRQRLQDLAKQSVQVKAENVNIQRILRDLNNELTEVQKQVKQEKVNIIHETKAAERMKRDQTMQRAENKIERTRSGSKSRKKSARKSSKTKIQRGKDFIRYNTNTAFSPTHRERILRRDTSREESPQREYTNENSPMRQESETAQAVRPPNQIYQDLIQQQLNQSSFANQNGQRTVSANEPSRDRLLSNGGSANVNNQQELNSQHQN